MWLWSPFPEEKKLNCAINTLLVGHFPPSLEVTQPACKHTDLGCFSKNLFRNVEELPYKGRFGFFDECLGVGSNARMHFSVVNWQSGPINLKKLAGPEFTSNPPPQTSTHDHQQ